MTYHCTDDTSRRPAVVSKAGGPTRVDAWSPTDSCSYAFAADPLSCRSLEREDRRAQEDSLARVWAPTNLVRSSGCSIYRAANHDVVLMLLIYGKYPSAATSERAEPSTVLVAPTKQEFTIKGPAFQRSTRCVCSGIEEPSAKSMADPSHQVAFEAPSVAEIRPEKYGSGPSLKFEDLAGDQRPHHCKMLRTRNDRHP